MNKLKNQTYKSILLSKRANIYFLEYCRVLVRGGRVEYVTEAAKKSLYWNIPIANTVCLLLGNGTSITQAAVRELAKAGVAIGFCGGSGTPLYSATEYEIPALWFSPQSEYRPTQYLQGWMSFWFDDAKRLCAAKALQRARLSYILKHWTTARFGEVFFPDENLLETHLFASLSEIEKASDTTQLLLEEARLTKQLFAFAAHQVCYGDFSRNRDEKYQDSANRFLDHGNYLAYGLAASAAWVLGLPHGFALMHGKTRRGGLIFDIADIIKDAIILPQAFLAAMRGDTDQLFRQACIDALTEREALDFMIETVEEIALSQGKAE